MTPISSKYGSSQSRYPSGAPQVQADYGYAHYDNRMNMNSPTYSYHRSNSAETNSTGVTNSTSPYSSNKSDATVSAIVAFFILVFLTGFPCWLVFLKCCYSSTDASDQSEQINSEQQQRRELRRQNRTRRQEMIQKHLIVREWPSNNIDPTAAECDDDDDDDDIEKQATGTATTHRNVQNDWRDETGTGDETCSTRSVLVGDSSDDDNNIHEENQHPHPHDNLDMEHPLSSSTNLDVVLDNHPSNEEICNERTQISSHVAAVCHIQSIDRGNITTLGCNNDCDEEGTNNRDEESPCCAICWSPFQSHEWICISNNEACHHIFHKECMTIWLLKHEECPMCRQVFLIEPDDANATDQEGDVATATEISETHNIEVAQTPVLMPMADEGSRSAS